ncbi:MAG: anthranilate phosphoribosyltransferase [Thermoplasmatota archaeon]
MIHIPQLLDRLLAGDPLSEEEAEDVMDQILTGELGPTRIAALAVALRAKGPETDELVGFARGMRAHGRHIRRPEGIVLDNCGTGGAPCKTFNISTAAAFVLAGAGITVAKHGNRSVTRPSGSADVLERAGAVLDLTPEACQRVLEETGIAFLFAPTFHPAMRHAGPVRQDLGIKTVFNLLGPLTNPASATHQVLGVYDPDLVEIMAEALARLGVQEGFVLHGLPGHDEATPCGPILYVRIQGGVTGDLQRVEPEALGIDSCRPESLEPVSGDDAPQLMQALLTGQETGPRADAVALNVAFGLVAAGNAETLPEGVHEARKLMAAGVGKDKWEAFVAATRSHHGG